MDEIISHYEKAIITFVVVVALIAVFVVLLNAQSGPVHEAFEGMIQKFFEKASTAIGP